MVVAMPIIVTAFVAPLTAKITAERSTPGPPAAPAHDVRLDEVTLQAILAKASKPVDDESVATTTVAPTTTTTVAPPPTTTTTTALPTYRVGNAGDFALEPDAKLPSDKDCTKAVRKAKEVRPENRTANGTKAKAPKLGPNWGSDPVANKYMNRVSGNFAGTTDEIIQWASCKWGFEADTVRAQVAIESSWRQTATAAMTDDQSKCPPGLTPPCPLAFGLLQIRNDYQPGTYPMSAQSTAYNLDYGLAMKRGCYDGHSWLGPQTKGDAWGCVGVHYSGHWLDDPAKQYIEKVQTKYEEKPWRRY